TALLFCSCVKDNSDAEADAGFLHGAFITNEGGFGNSNGSVSYFDTDSAYMINHVFELANGRPLGDVVQSVAVAGEKGFIVVNNSQKVEVVDLKTFESIGVIEGLEYPSFFLAINDKKGYLTDGNFSGHIYVIDIELLKIIDTIPCGNGPEKMILFGKSVLVANSGGWGNDSTLTVIDTDSDKVTATWAVGMNPADLVLDKDNQLWVLCKGKVTWNPDYTIGQETSSVLVVLDPESGRLKQNLNIGTIGDFYWPLRMGINKNKDRIYYLEAGGVYSISSSGSQLMISGNLYGFGVDPETDMIYTLYAPSFTTSGLMYRYNPDGIRLDSLEVGIGPSQIVFN
ncbi:MAG: hypothetical protein NTV01_05590, partial [Bacteroidia bacterium]|nr:hypothetical protein [Bacteroidia bacterium]